MRSTRFMATTVANKDMQQPSKSDVTYLRYAGSAYCVNFHVVW